MEKELKEKFDQAIQIGKFLFDRGKVTGSTGNMSFVHEDFLYITGSGTCFGRLRQEDFTVLDKKGIYISGAKPSKELPIHSYLYAEKAHVEAIIHTHSFYTTLFSCLPQEKENDIMPNHTPYLRMKVGKIGLIPYALPGSVELFSLFQARVAENDGYILQNHGLVIGASSLWQAFYDVEELEESARIAYFMQGIQKNFTTTINNTHK